MNHHFLFESFSIPLEIDQITQGNLHSLHCTLMYTAKTHCETPPERYSYGTLTAENPDRRFL